MRADAYETLVWLFLDRPDLMYAVMFLVFGGATGWCVLCCWTEVYTVTDTLRKIWKHLMWSLFYGILSLLLGVQTYYAYTHLAAPLTMWNEERPSVAETITVFTRDDWIGWLMPVFSE